MKFQAPVGSGLVSRSPACTWDPVLIEGNKAPHQCQQGREWQAFSVIGNEEMVLWASAGVTIQENHAWDKGQDLVSMFINTAPSRKSQLEVKFLSLNSHLGLF